MAAQVYRPARSKRQRENMTKDEAEIRSIIADHAKAHHAKAHHAKNVDLLLAHSGEGFLSFDLASPLQNKGGSPKDGRYRGINARHRGSAIPPKSEDEMIAINPEYFRRLINAGNTQVADEDIPPIKSVFDLKSGVRAKLVDRSGLMVIVEVRDYRSDWIEWSEVKARIAAK